MLFLLTGCSVKRNTWVSRSYHSMTTHFNILFNGNQNYKKGLKDAQKNYKEDYTQVLPLFPEAQLALKTPNSAFDRSIEKAVKAQKLHSIKAKPKRNNNKMNDPKYITYYNRSEFNNAVIKAWQLQGRSQFYKGDFQGAAATFGYVNRYFTHDPEVSVDAALWAIRSYVRLGWKYEAEDGFAKLPSKDFPPYLNKDFAVTRADFLIFQKRYKEAISMIEEALKGNYSSQERRRYFYVLGQLYQLTKQYSQSYESYGQVLKNNPAYELELNARIRQAEVFVGGDYKKIVRNLTSLAKRAKNEEYADQIYFALGNVHLAHKDTLLALEAYRTGAEKSKQGGSYKAAGLIKMGDLFFDTQKYVKAQPNYSEAIGLITEDHPDYLRVQKRGSILEELVIFSQNVELQDSLQRLAAMGETERNQVIDKIIEEVIRLEKEAEKKRLEEEKEAYLADKRAENAAFAPQQPTGTNPIIGNTDDSWYFYNKALVNNGKMEFQKRWGRRKLEDGWKWKDKANFLSDDFASGSSSWQGSSPIEDPLSGSDVASVDSLPDMAMNDSLAENPKKREFYLKDIPFTAQDIESSNIIIEDGLYNMAVIYRNRLENIPLSIATFLELLRRFPQTEYKLESYFNMYMMYMKSGNAEMAQENRAQIIQEYPSSKYASILIHPDYQKKYKEMVVLQDSLYAHTYQAFLRGNLQEVTIDFRYAEANYSLSPLIPRFMLLYAMTLARNGKEADFRETLKELVNKYPDSPIAGLAGSLLENFSKGMKLSKDGFMINADWRDKFALASDTALASLPPSKRNYTVNRQGSHYLLFLFDNNRLTENQVLYDIAGYNFSNFMIKSFDLEAISFGTTGAVVVKGFSSYNDVMWYRTWLLISESFKRTMYDQLTILIISEDNFDLLRRGKSVLEYQYFYQKYYIEDPLGKKQPYQGQDPDKEQEGDPPLQKDQLLNKRSSVINKDQ